MSIQEIIVLVVVIMALIYIGLKLRRRFSPEKSCDCSACGIEDCNERK